MKTGLKSRFPLSKQVIKSLQQVYQDVVRIFYFSRLTIG